MDAGPAWERVCASLDVIGDTEQALGFYLAHPPSDNYARGYLMVYGTLQALYLQQDAIESLCSGLGLPYRRSEVAERIRQVRNDAAGHPTDRNRGRAFVFIARYSVTTHSFSYHRNGADGTFTANDVDLRDLVKLQREDSRAELIKIADALEQEWRAHMAKHSVKKLADLLPDSWTYLVEKIFREIELPEHLGMGSLHVKYLLQYLSSIQSALHERNEPIEWLDFRFDEVTHALQRLEAHFAGRGLTGLETQDYVIFATFVSAQLKILEQRLTDIDEEYSQTNE